MACFQVKSAKRWSMTLGEVRWQLSAGLLTRSLHLEQLPHLHTVWTMSVLCVWVRCPYCGHIAHCDDNVTLWMNRLAWSVSFKLCALAIFTMPCKFCGRVAHCCGRQHYCGQSYRDIGKFTIYLDKASSRFYGGKWGEVGKGELTGNGSRDTKTQGESCLGSGLQG